jgi:glycosyltransferase domain-containing protein
VAGERRGRIFVFRCTGTEIGSPVTVSAVSPRLTIVLPLRGRHLFTLRFLWHANEARLPYRILIADGQVNEAIARHIENSRVVYPNLDIDYVRYPNDTGYSRYFAKMADALKRVRTPYAMLADNDDFLGLNGIEDALDFLETSPDYVGALGQPVGFSAYSGIAAPGGGVYGRLNRLRTYPSRGASAPSITERLREGGLSLLIYYSIYRTEALATLWGEDSEIDFTDLMLHETYHAMRTITLGKVRANKAAVTYFSQIGTSTSSDPMRDWPGHLLRSRFTVETRDMVDRIVAAAPQDDAADVAEQSLGNIESYFRDFLWTNYGMVAQIKRCVRNAAPTAVKYWQSRPRFAAKREIAAVLGKLVAAGASEQVIDRTRGEISAIERALSPQSFAVFAAPFLEMARAGSGRDWV